ncbi:MAG: cation:proton antiporter [Methanosarcinaceae archaeon]|nr:cation:proton antiporter [Methanosarcinaceae archaeon]
MTTIIAQTISKAVFAICLMYSVNLFIHGANYPGGGFIGGVLLVCGIILIYVTFGINRADKMFKQDWFGWFGFGLLFASIAAIFPMFKNHNYFRSAFNVVHFEFFGISFGELEFASSMMFDVGVYFVVIGGLVFIITQIGKHKYSPPKEKDEKNVSLDRKDNIILPEPKEETEITDNTVSAAEGLQ